MQKITKLIPAVPDCCHDANGTPCCHWMTAQGILQRECPYNPEQEYYWCNRDILSDPDCRAAEREDQTDYIFVEQ